MVRWPIPANRVSSFPGGSGSRAWPAPHRARKLGVSEPGLGSRPWPPPALPRETPARTWRLWWGELPGEVPPWQARSVAGGWGSGGAHYELLGDSTAEPAIPSEGRLFCLRLSLAFRREGLSPSSSTSAHKPVIEMACPSSRDFLIMHADSENRPCSSGKRDVGHERERFLDYQQVLHSRYPRVDGIGLREQGTGYGPQCASPSHTLRPRGRRGQLRHLFAPTRR